MKGYIYNVLRSFEQADALEDTTEDRGIVRKLEENETIRFEIKPGVILEVKGGTEGISVREAGMSGSQQLTIMPTSSNLLYITATRV